MPGRFLTHYFNNARNHFAQWYRQSLAVDLRKHGLYLEDLIVETSEIKAALKLMPKEELHLRNMRLLRAHDLTIKHAEVPLEQQDYDPLHSYLKPYLHQVLSLGNEIRSYDSLKRRQYSSAWQTFDSACSFVFRKKAPQRYVDRFLCTKYPYFDEWDKPWYKLPRAPSMAQAGGRPITHSDLGRALETAEKAAKEQLAQQGYKPKMSEEQRNRVL